VSRAMRKPTSRVRRRRTLERSAFAAVALSIAATLAGCSGSDDQASSTTAEPTTTTTTIPLRDAAPDPCLIVDATTITPVLTKATTCAPLAQDAAGQLVAMYDDRAVTRGVIAPLVTAYVRTGLLADGVSTAQGVSTGFDDDAVVTVLDIGEGGFIARGPNAKYATTTTTTTIKGTPTTASTTTTTIAGDDTNIDSANPETATVSTVPSGTPTTEFVHVGVVRDQAWVVVTLNYYATTPKDTVATDEELVAIAIAAADALASPVNRGREFSPTSTSTTTTSASTTTSTATTTTMSSVTSSTN
jgi:hypothetical protein